MSVHNETTLKAGRNVLISKKGLKYSEYKL